MDWKDALDELLAEDCEEAVEFEEYFADINSTFVYGEYGRIVDIVKNVIPHSYVKSTNEFRGSIMAKRHETIDNINMREFKIVNCFQDLSDDGDEMWHYIDVIVPIGTKCYHYEHNEGDVELIFTNEKLKCAL